MSSSFFVFFKVFSRVQMGCGTAGIGGVYRHPLSQQADSSPAHGAGEPWVVPLRRSAVGYRGAVLRNGRCPFPTLGGVRFRREFLGIGGVYCGTVITVPYIGVFADSPGFLGNRRGVLRNGRCPFPTLGFSPVVANLNAQGNDPTYSGTTIAAPITVWVCILCRKTVQPELHR